VKASSQHWFEEHTGEVQLHLVAPTLPQLFVEAGLALAELIAEDGIPLLVVQSSDSVRARGAGARVIA